MKRLQTEKKGTDGGMRERGGEGGSGRVGGL